MKTTLKLIAGFFATGAHAQELIKAECLRKGPIAGTEAGDEFTDATKVVSEVPQASQLFAFLHCEENNVLIGLRPYTQDVENTDNKNKLEDHGVTYKEGTCAVSALPSQTINQMRVYTTTPTGADSDIVVGLQIQYLDLDTSNNRTVTFGAATADFVETDTPEGLPAVGFYGSTGVSGFLSLGVLLHDVECKEPSDDVVVEKPDDNSSGSSSGSGSSSSVTTGKTDESEEEGGSGLIIVVIVILLIVALTAAILFVLKKKKSGSEKTKVIALGERKEEPSAMQATHNALNTDDEKEPKVAVMHTPNDSENNAPVAKDAKLIGATIETLEDA